MKKTRFFSMLTSLAVTSSLVLAAMPFVVNAETSPVSLEMVSGKTKFSLDDVKDGKAKTTIYVDVTSELTEDDEVTNIEFELVPEKWGTVDPKNAYACDPNQLATVNGGPFMEDGFSAIGTVFISEWTKDVEKPTVIYQLLDFMDSPDKYTGPSDKFPAKATIMTDSSFGYMVTGDKDAGDHLMQFDVYLPADLEAGTYDINFRNAKSVLGSAASHNSRLADITDAKGITITVAEGDIDDDFLLGDANLDKKVNVRDCATIASALAKGKADSLPERESDYNEDGKVNVRDAAALASDLAKGTLKVK